MRRAGLSQGPLDPDTVRWIAVRHDDTSIHIAYTKVRESGRAAGYVNYTRAWESMRHEWEERLGSIPTGKADGTARRPYGQAESARAKAAQHAGDVDARPDTAELRHLCRVVALEVCDVGSYLARLRAAGLTIAEDRGDSGELTGYRVGLRARAVGEPVLYASGRLDPALDLGAMAARWDSGGGPEPTSAEHESEYDVSPRAEAVANAPDLEDLLRRAADLTGDRAYFDAAETYGPAGRRARTLPGLDDSRRPVAAQTAHQLRSITSLLGTLARLDPETERRIAAAELALAIASLLTDRAAWHEQRQDRSGARAVLRAQQLVAVSAAAPSSWVGARVAQKDSPTSRGRHLFVPADAPTRRRS